MKVIWPKDNLNKIEIESPPDAASEIYNGVAGPTFYVAEGTEVDETTFNLGQNTDPHTQTTIRLTFDKSQHNRDVEVIFTDDSGKEYPVNILKVPSSS